jgi:uncharacterized damage-inducible protein DinB
MGILLNKKTKTMKPSSLLFSLLALIFISSSAIGQFTQSQLVVEWQRAKIYTKAYLDAMPEDGYGFKPTPEIRSFGQQMLHLAAANYLFGSVASDKANPAAETLPVHEKPEKKLPQTKEETTKAVMDSYDWIISCLQGMTAAQMQETIKFAKTEITRSGLYGKAFEHQTHHRGQTTIYLRLKGVTPRGEELFN